MVASFSSIWNSAKPFMLGLNFARLMNQSLERDNTSRQERHHYIAAANQILGWSVALAQVARCLQVVNSPYSLKTWNIAKFVVPIGVAYLASRQIKVLHITEAANFAQNHLGKISFAVMVVATSVLLILGQTAFAFTTLTYLTIGVLDRYHVLPESAQKWIHHVDFFVGNFAGLCFGGNFIRFICVVNLSRAVAEKYFGHGRLEEERSLEIG